MRRGGAVAGIVLLWLLLGPLVLVLAIASLFHPVVRDWIRPERPWKVAGVTAAVLAGLALVAVVVPDGWLPIPPGPGLWVTPSYVGRAAIGHPVAGLEVPQHPHLARNGTSTMHGDAWATDTYTWAGPEGDRTQVDTAWYGVEECATLAFARRDRLVGLCGRPRGPVLHVIDPASMHILATRTLPGRSETGSDAPRLQDLCGGAYFYLDEHDRAVLATTDRQIWTVATDDGHGEPELAVTSTVDLSRRVPADDCLIALMPGWDGGTWFETRAGRVGLVTGGHVRMLNLHEAVANSFAVDSDGIYVVTTDALYRVSAPGGGRPRVDWRTTYDNGIERKPGQLSQGSGTTPTLLPGGLVAVTDNADPRMDVLFLDRATGREVCRAPVFARGESATENSLVAVGPSSVVVENNYGYSGPLSTILGRAPSGGFARVDLAGGECRVAWTSDQVAPTSVAKMSLANGLLYAWTTRHSWLGVNAWYLTAIDVATGRTVFSVRAGTGAQFNNHYAAVTLAPDGSAYVATLAGLVRIHDKPGSAATGG